MASIPVRLVSGLQASLNLKRAVETGTFEGDGTRELARIFPEVVTIELSEVNFQRASRHLRAHPNVEMVLGDSGVALGPLLQPQVPTLYFLDGHWSEGPAGKESQCPVLQELAALRGGHPDDCIIIDDAAFFLAAPPLPYNPSHWPRLMDVLDALRAQCPSHHVTLLDNQIIAVPVAAAAVVDAAGQRLAKRGAQLKLGRLRRRLLGDVLGPLSPTRRRLRHLRRLARDGADRWSPDRRSAAQLN
ncbi:MAG: hypothetical protein WKF86_02330 [Acidimicrobiales bacterium]